MSLQVENLTPAIGAIIHGVDLGGAATVERHAAAIRQALEQAKPGKAVFLSSIGSEQRSGLGRIDIYTLQLGF